MIKLHSKWGVQIIGEDKDVAYFKSIVEEGIIDDSSYFISSYASFVILRTRLWDEFGSMGSMLERAEIDLLYLLGATSLFRRTNNFEINTAFEFNKDGTIKRNEIRKYGVIPASLVPIEKKYFITAAYTKDENIREALYRYSATCSWIDIYMCYEALKKYFGGNDKVFQNKFLHIKTKLELTRRTANTYRHAFNSNDNDLMPIDIGEARRVLQEVFHKALDETYIGTRNLKFGTDYTQDIYIANAANPVPDFRLTGGTFVDD